jgi:hypothetical protein
MAERGELAGEIVCTDARLHADQARRQIGKPSLDLAARPLLAEDDRTTTIVANHVERVLADVDADHGDL